jgi:hypothetical protein
MFSKYSLPVKMLKLSREIKIPQTKKLRNSKNETGKDTVTG